MLGKIFRTVSLFKKTISDYSMTEIVLKYSLVDMFDVNTLFKISYVSR